MLNKYIFPNKLFGGKKFHGSKCSESFVPFPPPRLEAGFSYGVVAHPSP